MYEKLLLNRTQKQNADDVEEQMPRDRPVQWGREYVFCQRLHQKHPPPILHQKAMLTKSPQTS